MKDSWRQIEGYSYMVSRAGEVRSLARNRLLAQVECERGYLRVNLYADGRAKNFLVHRLVAAAFLGNIRPGMQVNHKDGDKHNNNLENLEIVTAEANREHARRTGLILRGEANPTARLSEDAVRDIRRMKADGVRVQDIAQLFRVCEATIYAVCRRITWGHVV